MPTPLAYIREKVLAGERLSLEDGLVLYDPATPLQEVGVLANIVRERKNGNTAYYNINTHLNATNVCVYRCTFCAFRSDLRERQGLRDERRANPGSRAGGGRQRLHRDAHRRRPAPSEEIRLVRQPRPHPARRLSRPAPQRPGPASRSTGSSSWPKRPVREILRRADRSRPRQHARRRGRDFSSRGPRAKSASTRPTPATGSTSTARPTSSASRPTARCSTATSKTPTTASII